MSLHSVAFSSMNTCTRLLGSVIMCKSEMFLLLVVTFFGISWCVVDDSVKEECFTAICSPECGISTANTTELDPGGIQAKEGELPWHVVIYSKDSKPYKQICSGTIIAPDLVLSAAYCFWSNVEKLRPASRFAVAAGKVHRGWNAPRDSNMQRSDVKHIKIPPRFRGEQTYLESDVAVLQLVTPFVYNTFVRPVCLDFELDSDRRHLMLGNHGIVSGWGLSAENVKTSQVLQIIKLPNMDMATCNKLSPVYFTPYITWDKICSGYPNGTALCDRDKGGGLVFPMMDGNILRHYLRGIFSTAPYDDKSGCSLSVAVFTHIRIQEPFIQEQITSSVQSTACQLPPYPDHGTYRVKNNPNAYPGDVLDSYYLEYECEPGYATLNDDDVYCVNGFHSKKLPKCEKVCRLDVHPSVEYLCHVPNSYSGRRQCEQVEPNGTTVTANCRAPNYYSNEILRVMKCQDGNWNYIAKCLAVCGAATPKGEILLSGGRESKVGEIPWHIGIYDKENTPYEQICGGSIVGTTLVISAAHCFWSEFLESLLPTSRFAVAAGKRYKKYDDSRDVKTQKTNVIDIKVPERFRGRHTSYQDDIALVFLATAIRYDFHIRPVCLDFDIVLERRQLFVGSLGKVAGWGLIDENGKETEELQVVELPYIDIKQCFDDVSFSFKQYITGDKICAGYTNGTALCKGDSGGGLAFPEIEKGEKRYYLRGVVSTAPRNENKCNVNAITAFTHIWRHELFIKENYFVT